MPLFLRLSGGRWADPFAPRLAAHAIASLSASAFTVLALTAVNGLLLLGVPRARLQAAETACRSLMLCALVLSVPLVGRLPGIAPQIAAQSPLLLHPAPPVWFLGVYRVMLGQATPYFERLAWVAVLASAAALAIAVALVHDDLSPVPSGDGAARGWHRAARSDGGWC